MNWRRWLRRASFVLVCLVGIALVVFLVQIVISVARLKHYQEVSARGKPDTAGQPILVRSILERDSAGVEEALKQSGTVNEKSLDGTPPLHLAAERGNAQLVARLLAAGADVNATDKHNYPAIAVASRRPDATVLEQLIIGGADPNTRLAHTDETPLVLASQQGGPEVVRVLLIAKANPNLTDAAGGTPLMYAVVRNDLVTAQLLLEGGASLSVSVANPLSGQRRNIFDMAETDAMRALLTRYRR